MSMRYPWHVLLRWPCDYLWPSTAKHGWRGRWPSSRDSGKAYDDEVIRVVFFGDLMPLAGQRIPLVDEQLRALLAQADLVVGNCEGPVADSSCTSALSLSMSERFLVRTLAALAVEPERCALSVANNHAGDGQAPGLEETARRLRGLGILPLGLTDADEGALRQRRCRDVSLGLVAWTRWLNRNPWGGAPPVRTTEPIRQLAWSEIKRSLSVDCLIGFPHWDYEWQHFPRPQTVALARELGAAGFDLLVGHHPHLLQPVGHYDETLCFHSLGNLTGPGPSPRLVRWPARLGALLEVQLLRRGEHRGRVAGYRLVPMVQTILDGNHHLLSLPNAPTELHGRMQRRWQLLFDAEELPAP